MELLVGAAIKIEKIYFCHFFFLRPYTNKHRRSSFFVNKYTQLQQQLQFFSDVCDWRRRELRYISIFSFFFSPFLPLMIER
jgi:hypothetical protein